MRSHHCGELSMKHLEQTVTLCGWVHKRRDHGGVIFIDLRDRFGVTQIVYNPENVSAFEIADKVRNEFVIKITGEVRLRPKGMINPNMPTGEIEIIGDTIEILNQAKPVPFQLDGYTDVSEDIRLTYRYLDLRKDTLQANLIFRSKVSSLVRQYLEDQDFLNIETPLLTKATPEGARDYLVPSRVYPGHFFALPQSPQIFKQLLMISSFDRYYQIAKCFRDEDLRADRQPEFTQIDIETSFLDENQIMSIAENMISKLFQELLQITLPKFQVISYQDSISKYGTDRPDLRFSLEMIDISEFMQNVDFKVFKEPANDANSKVVLFNVPKGAVLSRKKIDEYTNLVKKFGAKGLAWIKVNELKKDHSGLQSPRF